MTEGITRDTYSASVEYVKRGWAVIPLHGIQAGSADRCTCKVYPCGAGNRNAGKHPVEAKWPSVGRISTADCWAVWREEYPRSNVGILTGSVSGIFVFDEDPDNGGDVSLAELIKKYGPLPETYTVRTGSGGHHYYFQMPDYVITNKNSMLPPGLDIRAKGGQVVAPPSVSGKGDYVVVKDVPIAPAPQWLLDILRAPEHVDIGEIAMVLDLPSYDSLDSATQERCEKYADSVLRAECEAYVNAPAGRGSDRLFLAACNLLEIAQSPWNLISARTVKSALDYARASRTAKHPSGGGQTPHELDTTLHSALMKVQGKGRALPAGVERDPYEGLYFDPAPFQPPFQQAPTVTPNAETVGAVPVSPEVAQAYDAHAEREALIAREMARLEILEEAKRRKLTGVSGTPEDEELAVQALLAKMLTPDDLEELPNPQPLIVDVLDLDSESWIIGAPGGFKSFVALDMAAHVGRGLEWRGNRVTQGNVVYVVAEGSKGIKLRAKAWRETYGPMENVRFLPEPVQVADARAWGVLIKACEQIKPVFVILDTQARITVGLNENSSELGTLIDAVRQLRAATGACVLVVHHTGRNGDNARGWSGLDGAQDSEIKVIRPEDATRKNLTAEIFLEKQKDGSEDPAYKFQMQVHDWGIDPDTGRKLSSLSLKPVDPFSHAPEKVPAWKSRLTDNQKIVLEVMRAHSDHDGATRAVIKKWLVEYAKENSQPTMPDGSMDSAIRDLKKGGQLIKDGSTYTLGELT